MKTKIVSSHTADSKPVKQQVNCTVILPPLVFPATAREKYAHIWNPKNFIHFLIKVSLKFKKIKFYLIKLAYDF